MQSQKLSQAAALIPPDAPQWAAVAAMVGAGFRHGPSWVKAAVDLLKYLDARERARSQISASLKRPKSTIISADESLPALMRAPQKKRRAADVNEAARDV
jgi:hypothetical protein